MAAGTSTERNSGDSSGAEKRTEPAAALTINIENANTTATTDVTAATITAAIAATAVASGATAATAAGAIAVGAIATAVAATAAVAVAEPPFSRERHLCAPAPDAAALVQVAEFRALLQEREDLYDEQWATDEQLYRCLIAKQFNKDVAMNLAIEALKWRQKRAPHLIENTEGWQRAFELESETGKIHCPGLDKWGRPVVCFDNAAANTTNIDAQMLFLGWMLNFTCREMPKNIDKYNIFMHLENFSFFSIPPLSATTETIHMLCNCFPERLGHCIAYRPPGLFKTFFNSVKPFIDPKTVSKMIFITGDVSDGSENDKYLRDLVGDDWKVLTGAEQPVLQKTKPTSSPGYLHAKAWPALMKRVEAVRERESREEEVRQQDTSGMEQASRQSAKALFEACSSPLDINSPVGIYVPEMYYEKEDAARITHASHADFHKKKVTKSEVNSLPPPEPFLSMSEASDGPVVTLFMLLLENFFYWVEDLLAFKTYLLHLFDSFFGPSTAPTAIFIRIAFVAHFTLHAGASPRMKRFMFFHIVTFLFLFFLFHDLRECKKKVAKFIEDHAI
jgi:hypothetical protein